MKQAKTSTNLRTAKMLFLDTCALVKLFVAEPGHDVLMWLLKDSNGEAILGYGVHVMTSVHVRDEFPRAVTKMIERGDISEAQGKGILERAEGYLDHPAGLDIVDTGPLPGFKGGADTSADALMQKHSLRHRDRTDCAILASIVNYLRCFGGASLPHVVTADGDFAKVIKAEKTLPLIFHPQKQTAMPRAMAQKPVYVAQMDYRYDLADIWTGTENEKGCSVFKKIILSEDVLSDAVQHLYRCEVDESRVYPD